MCDCAPSAARQLPPRSSLRVRTSVVCGNGHAAVEGRPGAPAPPMFSRGSGSWFVPGVRVPPRCSRLCRQPPAGRGSCRGKATRFNRSRILRALATALISVQRTEILTPLLGKEKSWAAAQEGPVSREGDSGKVQESRGAFVGALRPVSRTTPGP